MSLCVCVLSLPRADMTAGEPVEMEKFLPCLFTANSKILYQDPKYGYDY